MEVLKDFGCIPDIGYDINISSKIPINSGLSSSSALIIAWVNFLLSTFTDHEITPNLLAEISYRIEVLEIGGSGGKMDQYTIANGKTIFLDTKTDNIIPFDHKLCNMIIGVSSQSKDTQGLLKKLKENALMSIEIVKNHDLDFSFTNIEKIDLNKYLSFLDDNLKPFFRAAIGNYRTTLKAKNEFYKNKLDIKKIADLINIHHSFLKNDLKITTPVIDDMIDIAMENGSIGCKIVGSGGGGSIVCLSEDKSSSLKIVNELKTLEMFDNTIIIYTSDHGFSLGNHGIWGHGMAAWPSSIHRPSFNIPLIFSGPGVNKGISNSLVSQLDLGNTILDLANAEKLKGKK